MPIYAYKCESCGHAKDVLQKMSDDPLSVCPACGNATFRKQVTAAGFQLKGSGWYVTDFREGQKPAANATSAAAETPKPAGESATPGATDTSAAPASAPAPAAAAPAAAPAVTPAAPPSST
jgi:putative FmdB family regulatory protein